MGNSSCAHAQVATPAGSGCSSSRVILGIPNDLRLRNIKASRRANLNDCGAQIRPEGLRRCATKRSLRPQRRIKLGAVGSKQCERLARKINDLYVSGFWVLAAALSTIVFYHEVRVGAQHDFAAVVDVNVTAVDGADCATLRSRSRRLHAAVSCS